MSSTTSTIVKVGCSLLGGAALLYVTKRLWEKKGTTASKECYFVGIDLGATNAKAGVVKDDGELIATSSEPLSDYSDTGVVKSLVKVCNNALEAAGLKWSDIGEIGIGSPGTIDFDNGIVIKASNFPTWDHVPLAKMIEEQTGVHAVLENDANAACAAECWVGAGKGKQNMVMITLGSGIGGGIVVNGRIIHGGSGWAGEPGHSIYKVNGTQCGCGQKGCYEKYASANGLVLVAKQYLAEHPNEPSSLRDVPELTAKAVMDAAKAGDAAATACVDIAAEALGVCCVNLCRIVDPELIVFSGGLATAGDFFLKKIDHYFHLYHWTIQEPTCVLQISEGSNLVGIVGAAAVARMDYLK
ncbi:hypothetical protein WA538_001449 [Blastocystis sp. DL]